MKIGRRRFIGLGVTAAAASAGGLSAATTGDRWKPRHRARIKTADGLCRSYLFTPDGPGRWPPALFLMDGFGIRPTLFGMAQRLADAGYAVLLPDLYYRAGPYAPLDIPAIFKSGNVREAVRAKFGEPTDNVRAASDGAAFLEWLTHRPEVIGQRVGVTGYCMSGGIALTLAGTYPDRIAVAASFHGGNLATDAPSSPHRLASAMKGKIFVGAAEKDASFPPEQARRLADAMTAARVDYSSEVYPETLHGWTMSDTPVYNRDAAERHWRTLVDLFGRVLKA